ncbi:hypothetical protein PAXRUDRAFT_821803 [Paxillus rubicundulus Ve08.2h10]|uniref:Unplaced genomic scaffold scaffold_14, whole genome shotgun sequence n=1 Tax=Paxillus rubicundulus Ve08.2h10 TaxID=930991 RepID=A0A0D0EAI0_9AGAM|nr:hypothetical protein PAXRUDRAFT_821803 [Paxillus rubicundulus Ve08.2h10]
MTIVVLVCGAAGETFHLIYLLQLSRRNNVSLTYARTLVCCESSAIAKPLSAPRKDQGSGGP